MTNIIPPSRLELARKRKALRDEQAFIEACERELEERGAKDMGELIDRAKARVDRERGQ